MPEISQHYTVHLMTLSPLHVGTGRELLRDYDYAVHQGRSWRIDEDALLEAALDPGAERWDDSLLRRPAAELLRPEDYRPDAPLFRYVAQGMPRSGQKGAQLREQIKDAWDRPYLPGASLKGALRTALFDHALAQNPGALNLGRLNNNRKWAAQPIERAVVSTISRNRSNTSSRTCGSKVRIVPRSSTSGGITLKDSPPWITPTLTTAVSKGETLRDTMLCKAMIICALVRTGSTVRFGRAPCPPLPITRNRNFSAAAIIAPGVTPNQPIGASFHKCRPRA